MLFSAASDMQSNRPARRPDHTLSQILGKDLIIRPLTAHDIEAFKAIRLLAISDSPSAVWPTADEEAQRTPGEVKARIEQTPVQIVFGAFSGVRLIGVAGLRRESLVQVAHKATLWGVFVHPEFRHAGIARQLFTHLREHALGTGILQIHLCVNAENARAKKLYQSMGFESFGLEPRAMRVGGRFYDEEHMWLRLDE